MKLNLRPVIVLLLGAAFCLPVSAQQYAFLNEDALALNKTRLQQHQAPELTQQAWQALQREAD